MKNKLTHIINSIAEIFNGNKMTDKQKFSLMKIGASLLLFIIGLFLGKIAILKFIIYLIAYLISAYDVIISAVKRAMRGNIFDENMLMTVASVGAFILGEFAEGTAVMILYQLGELFQSFAVNRSRRSIKAMLALRPNIAHKVRGNEVVDVETETLTRGDICVVRPGERVPIDGVVVDGVLEADVSAITGESLPSVYKEGDAVLSGFINLSSIVRIKATADDAESTVTRILKIVEEQQENKSESEKFVTKFAHYYTPAVFGLTLILAVVVPLIFGDFRTWIYRALSLLVISCPCALVISVPLTYFGGIGGAGSRGILLKGGTVIDALCEADTLMLDKTGTLTTGKLEVIGVHPTEGISAQVLISVAKASEGGSNHPIAKAIYTYASEYVDDTFEYENYREIPGDGCIAESQNHIFIGGSRELLEKLGIECPDDEYSGTKRTFFAFDKIYVGYIELSDSIKADAPEAIEKIRCEGISRIGMFSGDKREIAEQTASILELDMCEAELKPEDKLNMLRTARASGAHIIFAGDGINDAPSLGEAGVGIAMGDIGSDAALEAADAVIMDGKLTKIAEALKISKYTRKIVKENIALTLGIKLLVLILTLFGLVNMTAAIFADVGVAIIAIINAMRTLTVE